MARLMQTAVWLGRDQGLFQCCCPKLPMSSGMLNPTQLSSFCRFHHLKSFMPG